MSKILQSFDIVLATQSQFGSKVLDSITGQEIKQVRNICITHKAGTLPQVRLEGLATRDGKIISDGDSAAVYEMTGYLNSVTSQ